VNKELQLWQFVADRLIKDESVMLLVVAESSGSSPGRAGYKMAVSDDGELCGSIGGGIMEVNLVEQSRSVLSEPGALATGFQEQVHQKNSLNASGMICSGKQSVIAKKLLHADLEIVQRVVECLSKLKSTLLTISNLKFEIEDDGGNPTIRLKKINETEFVYCERIGHKHELFIIGGGHCSLALSELMSRLDFRISIFDDRPALNTLDKNDFADETTVIEKYDDIALHIPKGDNVYVVVMTLGYAFDAIVIRKLIDHDVKYLGVLGSRAKMATLMKELKVEGFDEVRLKQIHTPIGIPINSRTPEEIAVSIAAEIISIKNS